MVRSLQGDTYGVGQAMLEWYSNHVAYGIIGHPDSNNVISINEFFINSIKFIHRNILRKWFYRSAYCT